MLIWHLFHGGLILLYPFAIVTFGGSNNLRIVHLVLVFAFQLHDIFSCMHITHAAQAKINFFILLFKLSDIKFVLVHIAI